MFFTAKLSKRKILVTLVVLAALLLLPFLLRGKSVAPETAPHAATDAERAAYLASFGWEVSSDPIETLGIRLPDPLQEPYLSYNELQLTQGFDLSAYCGQTLTRCTYVVHNYPGHEGDCQADLYLCGDRIVAGDVVCTGEGGFLAGLAFPE